MMSDWLWPALALLLIIEGIGPLLFPNRWQSYLRKLSAEPAQNLRQLGFVLVLSGICWLWWLNQG
jgi:uncharacterized protein YjeT (DUF2065 family)